MILGIAGKAQSGKDTVAEYIVKKYKFVKYSFADPIKEGCKKFFGFTDEQCWGKLKDVTDPHWQVTPRKILQIMGTEVFQYFMPHKVPELKTVGRYFWVHLFIKWYKENEDKNVIIPDVRFLHEIESIRRLEGKVVRVSRSNIPSVGKHASEMELDNYKSYDTIIVNNGTITELNKEITRKMAKWL